jgi:5-methylcytosine-specific restriction endonuclease McrA
MRAYSLSHLSDHDLLRDLTSIVARDRATTATLLAHIAEVDARRLYLPAAYPSMYAYCVHELRLSEDSAYKRIHVARAARQFPAIFDAVADGRLHLSAVGLLAPHLTTGNARELIASAARKTKSEVEQLIAERFPRTELMPMVDALPAQSRESGDELAPGQVESRGSEGAELAPGQVESRGSERVELAPGQVGNSAPRWKITPIAHRRYALHVVVGQEAIEKLRHAQALLGHQLPSGDVAPILEAALDALVRELEKRKFAATERPQRAQRPSTSRRHIPTRVRRAVWERDGGRCTFISESGRRCEARARLEFDHVDPVACGGRASEDGIRLRCRAHNQYTAECAFGSGFMIEKRGQARRDAAARRRARSTIARRPTDGGAAAPSPPERDVVPWLRRLGFRPDEVRRAARCCDSIPDASLEERVRLALSHLRPRTASCGRALTARGVVIR